MRSWSRSLFLIRHASWKELRTRAGQELAKRWYSMVYSLLEPPQEAIYKGSHDQGQFFFATEDIPRIVEVLSRHVPESIERTIHSAEDICRHRFALLGHEGLDFGNPIDWHLDAVNNRSAPHKPFHKIHYLDFDEAGDVKVTWELNRHQHLVTLARAYCFTRDERFVRELMDQWYSWRQENPYPQGVNWASSLEVAFRCLSWLWLRHLLAECPQIPPEFWADLGGALLLGGHHIERYLSTYFAPNTHLLGEGVALFFLGVLCGKNDITARWKKRGWDIVLRESERQVLADGMHFEQSTYYNVYALDFFLHARILAGRNQIAIPQLFDETLKRMLQAMATLSRTGGLARFGDDDGGRLFNPRRNRAENLLDPLSTGAALFRCPDFKPATGELVEETVWLLGPEAAATFESLGVSRPELRAVALRSSGLYLMTHGGPHVYELVIDAGPQGANGAGHGHADALSLQVSVDGHDLLTDPGTFVYVGPDAERLLFRGTAVHNTLLVDGKDQAEAESPFRWRLLPEVRVEKCVEGDAFYLLVASHTGYQRLPEPVLHRRAVFQLKDDFWFVLDTAEGSGTHDFVLPWHLAPGFEWQPQGKVAIASGARGSLTLVPDEQHGWTQTLQEGWYSPVYGRRAKMQCLRFHCRDSAPVELATVLIPAVVRSADAGVLSRARDASPKVYRYDSKGRHHLLIFKSGNNGWQWRHLASDAEFCYYGTTDSGDESLILSGGTYFSVGGEHLIDCSQRIERIELSFHAGTWHTSCSKPGALKFVLSGRTAIFESLSEPLAQHH